MTRYWRGAYLDDRTADMMEEVARLCGPHVNLRPTQGSYSGGVSASGGTHDGCGAIDLAGQDAGMDSAERNTIRDNMRRVGFGAWVRTPDQSDWPYHVHGIAVQPGGKSDRGCLAYAAHDQIVDYFEGRNGLASGAPDDGPREWVGMTWETYQQTEEDDMPSIDEFVSAWRSEGMSGAADPNYNGNSAVQQAIKDQVDQWRSEGMSGSGDPYHNGSQQIVDAIYALGANQQSARRSTRDLVVLAFTVTICVVLIVAAVAVATGRLDATAGGAAVGAGTGTLFGALLGLLAARRSETPARPAEDDTSRISSPEGVS